MSALAPETRSIEFVPYSEQHVGSLFTLWFGANLQVTTIAAGGISVDIGLPLPSRRLRMERTGPSAVRSKPPHEDQRSPTLIKVKPPLIRLAVSTELWLPG